MGFKTGAKSPFTRFLSASLMAGGTPPATVINSYTRAYVASVSSVTSFTEGVPIVFTVTLKAAASGSLTLLIGTTGTAISGTNYSATPTFSNGVTKLNNVLSIPNGVTTFTITYTTTDVGYFAVPKTLYVLVDFIMSTTLFNSSAEVWTQITEATGITIPTDFVGMHHHSAYSAYTNIATAKHRAFRSHDNQVFWYQIEPSVGTYSWTALDALITAYQARASKTFMFCLWGTPKFYVIPTPNQVWQASHVYSVTTTADTYVINSIVGASSKQCRYACVKAGTSASGADPTGAWPIRGAGIRAGAGGNTLTWSAGTVTVDAKTNHGYTTGDWVETTSNATGGSAWYALAQVTVTGLQTYTYPLAVSPSPTSISGLLMTTGIVDGTAVWVARDHESVTIPADASPADPTAVNTFIAALMARYNVGGVRKISILEVWNEPDFSHSGKMFFRGTASQMVDMVWAARLASKAADGATNNIPVIGCGFTYYSGASNNSPTIYTEYLNASGITYSTKTGVQTLVDGVSYHGYNMHWMNGSSLNGIGMNGTGYIRNFRTLFTAAGGDGANVPIWLTECGITQGSGGSPTPWNAWQALSANGRKINVVHELLFYACCNMKGYYIYDYDGNYSGNFDTDTVDNSSGSRGGLDEFDTLFAGKTITSAYFSNGYKLKVTISGVDYIYDALTNGSAQ
jgi:hypothetical protein